MIEQELTVYPAFPIDIKIKEGVVTLRKWEGGPVVSFTLSEWNELVARVAHMQEHVMLVAAE